MKTIAEALAALPYPCCHPPYRGGADKYITYQLLGQSGVLYAEGCEAETAVGYMVHLWCAGSGVYDLLRQVKPLLEAAGYIVTVDVEIYEKEARLHRIVLTANTEGAVYG